MRRDEVSLEDIRNAARRARSYIEDMTRTKFLTDDKTKAAVVRELEIMGEAASRLVGDLPAGTSRRQLGRVDPATELLHPCLRRGELRQSLVNNKKHCAVDRGSRNSFTPLRW